jgi:O-antigen/teichoic acid export membrane protein
MRFLDPAMYGLWLGLLLVLTYGGYVHMGMEHGMNLRLLYYQGRRNAERVRQIQDTTFTTWTFLSLVFSFCVLGYVSLVHQPSTVQKLGLVVISGIIICEQQIAFLARWQTSFLKDFSLVSMSNILKSILSFTILIPLACLYDVSGVIVGSLVVSNVMMIFWWLRTSYRPHIRLTWDVLWEILRIGFPMLLVVIGGVLVETVDRLIILNLLGTASLGYYGITSFGGSSVYRLLAQAGSSMVPHMVEDMGRYDSDPQSLLKYLIKPTLIFSYMSVIMITFLILLVSFLVEWMLPRYLPGMRAFYIFTPGFFFLSIIITANNILNLILIAKRQQRFVIYIQSIAIIIEVFFAIILIRFGLSIEGVALASVLTCAFYGFSVLSMAGHYVILDWQARFRFLGDVLVPFIYALAVVPLVIYFGKQIISENSFGRLILQCVLTVLLYCPLLYYLNKKLNLLKELEPIFVFFGNQFGLLGTKKP